MLQSPIELAGISMISVQIQIKHVDSSSSYQQAINHICHQRGVKLALAKRNVQDAIFSYFCRISYFLRKLEFLLRIIYILRIDTVGCASIYIFLNNS